MSEKESKEEMRQRDLKSEKDLVHGTYPFLDLKIEGLYGKEYGWPL